jgi:uncharacterized protein YheU (UPF0270 family)
MNHDETENIKYNREIDNIGHQGAAENIKHNRDTEYSKESASSEDVKPPVEVPNDALSSEALTKVIDYFIMREGTDYGAVELTHETKVERVRKQLASGKIKIVFDPNTESVTLMTEQDWKKWNQF